ncbi:restriction endonuclease subunit S [Serratia liquefaciens]|uniref:restriction endonuclease subunit S n=1 Tax=Serratia liquefaciens TaxID=614 RepID=UPI0022DD5D5D|nr:restriction endonuclease subunit S [Serratia liquefaciens]WBL71082.1 restriction endonuclease subunit S [Serratia liquefaciens]
MGFELKREELGSLVAHKKGFAFKSKDYISAGVPVVRVSNFTWDSISTDDLRFVAHEVAISNKMVRLNEDDVVIATVGSWPQNPASIVGKVVRVPRELSGALLNQNTVRLRVVDEDLVNQKYLYISLKTKDFSEYLISKAQGSANQASITLSDIFSYSIPWGTYAQRKFIVSVIDSINSKIVNAKRINQTLEQMAQALFKNWFVDFEPVKAKIAVLESGGSQEEATFAAMTAISGKSADALAIFEREHPEQYAELKATAELFPSAMQESELGEIPEGWAIGNLGEIIEFNPKRILKKGINAPYLDMKNVPVKGHSVQEVVCREVTSGTKFKNGDTLLARITPCLENGKTAFVDFLSSNDTVGWGSTEFIVMRVKRDLPLSISYFIARLESFRITAIQSMQGTSGRQRADAGVLQNMPWVIPPDALLMKFGKFSNFVIDNNRVKHNQNTLLSQLRDTLLPKLLSGEITLPEAEEIAKETDYV